MLLLLLLTSFLHSPLPVISLPSNSVAVAYTDDGEPYGGRGGAVFNGGDSSTILFNRLALFKNNVGALVSKTITSIQVTGRFFSLGGAVTGCCAQVCRTSHGGSFLPANTGWMKTWGG